MGGRGEGRAPAPVQDIHAPGLPRPRKPLDEAVVVFSQNEAHQQHFGPARPRKTPSYTQSSKIFCLFLLCSTHLSTPPSSDHPALDASLLPQVSRYTGRQPLHCPLGPIPDLLFPRDDLHCSDHLPEPKGMNVYGSFRKDSTQNHRCSRLIEAKHCTTNSLTTMFSAFFKDHQIED